MSDIKGIIFDLDGVLVFTDEYHYLAWKAVFDERNIYFDRNMNKLLRGVSRAESLEIVLRENDLSLGEEEKRAILQEKNDLYVRYLNEKLNPHVIPQETINALLSLKNKGLKLAVGSSSKNARLILGKIELVDCFDAISDGTMIKKSKPDPEVFLLAASLIGLSPNECAVIEDGAAGIEAAIDGGFTPIGIGNDLPESDAYRKISSLSELATLI